MANREESDAAEHETFPGTGALRGDDAHRGVHPVEQMVDAAIERLAREQSTSALASTAVTRSDALARAPRDGQALAMAPRRPGRLRWKGMDVSEEFRRYAERVARGEDLPPFTGKILAEPDVAFPWQAGARPGPKPQQSLRHQLGLWAGSVLLIGGIGWSIFSALRSLDSDPLQRGESPLATAVFSNQPSSETSLDDTEKPARSDQIATASGSLGTESGEDTSLRATNGTGIAAHGALGEKSSSPVVASQAAPALGKPAVAPAAAVPAPGAPPKAAPAAQAAPAQPSAPRAYIGLANGTGVPVPQNTGLAAAKTGGGGITLSTTGGTATPSAAAPNANVPVPVISPPANPSAISGTVAAGTPSDSKKEPGTEASAKGALLVETPSF